MVQARGTASAGALGPAGRLVGACRWEAGEGRRGKPLDSQGGDGDLASNCVGLRMTTHCLPYCLLGPFSVSHDGFLGQPLLYFPSEETELYRV